MVGSVGPFWPPGEGVIEIGYGVVPSRRGRGYGSEATRVLAVFAQSAPGVQAVCADVEASNPSSVRVLEKAGFHRSTGGQDMARYRFTGTDHRQ